MKIIKSFLFSVVAILITATAAAGCQELKCPLRVICKTTNSSSCGYTNDVPPGLWAPIPNQTVLATVYSVLSRAEVRNDVAKANISGVATCVYSTILPGKNPKVTLSSTQALQPDLKAKDNRWQIIDPSLALCQFASQNLCPFTY